MKTRKLIWFVTLACMLPVASLGCKLLGKTDGTDADSGTPTTNETASTWGATTYLTFGFDTADLTDSGGTGGAGLEVSTGSTYNHAATYWGGADKAIFALNKYCGIGTDSSGNSWLHAQYGVTYTGGTWSACTPAGASICELYMDFSQHLPGSYDPNNYTLEFKFAMDPNVIFEVGFDMHFSAGNQMRIIPGATSTKIYDGAFNLLATGTFSHAMSRDQPITYRLKVVNRNTITLYESPDNDGSFTPLISDLDISAATASFTRQPGLIRVRMDQSCAGSLAAARIDYLKLISN